MIDLETAKNWVRVDHSEDDQSIEILIKAATDTVYQYLNRKPDADGWVEPESVKMAILQIVADLYEKREAQHDGQTYYNKMLDKLLNPHCIVNI